MASAYSNVSRIFLAVYEFLAFRCTVINCHFIFLIFYLLKNHLYHRGHRPVSGYSGILPQLLIVLPAPVCPFHVGRLESGRIYFICLLVLVRSHLLHMTTLAPKARGSQRGARPRKTRFRPLRRFSHRLPRLPACFFSFAGQYRQGCSQWQVCLRQQQPGYSHCPPHIYVSPSGSPALVSWGWK